MIKPDDIKKHTAEFFTSDPDFVLWCLDPERAQDGYWCGYTERIRRTWSNSSAP